MNRIYSRDTIDYSTLDAANISTLLEIEKSPKHYLHRLKHPKPPTQAMRLGTVAHVAVLEPERFLREFALWPAERVDEKTGEVKKAVRNGKHWEAFKAKNQGKDIVREQDYDEAIRLQRAIRRDRVAMKYLAVGEPEVTLQWIDKRTGIVCKGRVDWLTDVDGTPYLVDLKTARDLEDAAFYRSATRLSYHVRMAFYADGFETITGKTPGVAVPTVESSEPFDVVTHIMPAEVLDVGREVYGELLEKLKRCRDSDQWPGLGADGEHLWALPPWAVPNDDADLDDLGLVGWQESA